MTNEFMIVGEHKDDGQQFLVLGEDGQYYDYRPEREDFSPVELDDNWVITGSEQPEIDEIRPALRDEPGLE